MFARQAFLPAAIATIAIATLTGCGQMRPSAKLDTYEASLTGAQEVPPVASPGNGRAEVQFNKETNRLTWKVTYSGLSGPAVAAHIHGPAAAGQNAGVLVPFTSVANQPIAGEATITPQQAADLAGGKWYVNVHTPAHPGGEIRGQLRAR